MTTTTRHPTILLVPGYWLGAWAWDEVLEHLLPHHPGTVPVTLPGLDPDDPRRSEATLEGQVSALLDLLALQGVTEAQPAVLVAHSGANAPVSLLLDRHPKLVARVVWVDSGPLAPGQAEEPGSAEEPMGAEEPREPGAGEVPDGVDAALELPPFDALAQGASIEGLDAAMLARFRACAVPEPGGVVRAAVTLTHDARRAVPTTLVCCSIPGSQVRELAAAGHPMFAEVALLEQVDVVDLPTGHWPMWSRPRELAEIIAAEADRVG